MHFITNVIQWEHFFKKGENKKRCRLRCRSVPFFMLEPEAQDRPLLIVEHKGAVVVRVQNAVDFFRGCKRV